MSKEQQELLDSAYENWKEKGRDFWEEQVDGMFTSELGEEKVDKISKDWFINKIKTDTEFSQRWELKIEERELFMEERWKMADLTPNMTEFDYCNKLCDEHNVPNKLITITYNDKIIESYK
jgi:hypothetical protein